MTDDTSLTTGGCFCGAVRYDVSGPLRDVVNCHCNMCQLFVLKQMEQT